MDPIIFYGLCALACLCAILLGFNAILQGEAERTETKIATPECPAIRSKNKGY